jgi:hypothetical protein
MKSFTICDQADVADGRLKVERERPMITLGGTLSMDTEDERALDVLLTGAGFFEAYLEKTFVAHRHLKSGGVQTVTIRVLDAGPKDPHSRFLCEARSDDGKGASGNPMATIGDALAVVHWYELD